MFYFITFFCLFFTKGPQNIWFTKGMFSVYFLPLRQNKWIHLPHIVPGNLSCKFYWINFTLWEFEKRQIYNIWLNWVSDMWRMSIFFTTLQRKWRCSGTPSEFKGQVNILVARSLAFLAADKAFRNFKRHVCYRGKRRCDYSMCACH